LIANINKINDLELSRRIPIALRKMKYFIKYKFFKKEDFPEKKFKDNFANVANPKDFGEYR